MRTDVKIMGTLRAAAFSWDFGATSASVEATRGTTARAAAAASAQLVRATIAKGAVAPSRAAASATTATP